MRKSRRLKRQLLSSCIFLENAVVSDRRIRGSPLEYRSMGALIELDTAKCQSAHIFLPVEETEQAWTEFRLKERMTLRQRTRTQAIQFKVLAQVDSERSFLDAKPTPTSSVHSSAHVQGTEHLHLQDEVQHILTEQDVLTAAKSEWHVKLFCSPQDTEYAYLAMEFVQGGDVQTALTAHGVSKEEDSKLRFTEMMMAIDALHQQTH
ncbi:hypothetical protein BGX21_005888 [Mortierella sp. AD011]|nr:hypothetical protein BGX21_005888 [Mortierella sp. AD011]